MDEYTINVGKIEDLQVTKDMNELDKIFAQAKSKVVQGGTVVLTRENPDGSFYNVDEITTEADLTIYKDGVLKYL